MKILSKFKERVGRLLGLTPVQARFNISKRICFIDYVFAPQKDIIEV